MVGSNPTDVSSILATPANYIIIWCLWESGRFHQIVVLITFVHCSFESCQSPLNREPTLYKLFVVKFKLWSCSQPSLILNLWIWGLINLWKWLFLQLVRKQPIQFLESKRKTDINVRTLSIGFVKIGSVTGWESDLSWKKMCYMAWGSGPHTSSYNK